METQTTDFPNKDTDIQGIDILRLRYCPDCGYLLHGLPELGRCPECGFDYDRRMIVLYGWAWGSNAQVSNARIGWASLALLMSLVGGIPLLINFLFRKSWWGAGIVTVVFTIPQFILLWRRKESESPLPSQLRLLPEGFAQRDGFGTVRLKKWGHRLDVQCGNVRQNLWRINIQRAWLVDWFYASTPVQFEFKSDHLTVQKIHDQIKLWISRAGGQDKMKFQ